MTKICFKMMKQSCDALGEFAEARLNTKPDKDVILTVIKVDGRPALQATRISKMRWLNRMIRWFGFGNATLRSVANFMNNYEPYLPQRFSDLQTKNEKEMLGIFYSDADLSSMLQLQKERYKDLKHKKTLGCEVFKQCVSHHNKKSIGQVTMILREHERIKIADNRDLKLLGLLYPNQDKIDQKYLAPQFDVKEIRNQNVRGFCYEYGLGVKKDRTKAFELYQAATQSDSTNYAAFFNLGRLQLEGLNTPQAIESFNKSKDILENKIKEKQKSLDDLKAKVQDREQVGDDAINEEKKQIHQEIINRREAALAPLLKDWRKDLKKIERALTKI